MIKVYKGKGGNGVSKGGEEKKIYVNVINFAKVDRGGALIY